MRYLRPEYRQELNSIGRANQIGDITWADVIRDAKRCCEYSSLTLEDCSYSLSGFCRPSLAVDDNTVAELPSKPRHSTFYSPRKKSHTN